jgi:hypothetical protein
MRAAALAAAVIAGFFGVMYLRFASDAVPPPPPRNPYVAGQPTCVVFRLASEEDSGPSATCGAIRVAFEATPWVPPTPVPRYARVVNTDGTCLNIRKEPGSAGQVLACEAEGVMLEDLLAGVFLEEITWARVRTPGGIEGWASTQYLER